MPNGIKNASYWLEVCRAHRLDGPELFRKKSDLGGSGNDVPFAQAFSNLSHAYLRDRAPSLLDHELGFQVIDRSEDNKKAVGIIAAKIGSQKVFVPFFFLKNNIKGHELLYLCDRDIFVPLKENWLNDLINRKPDILGTGIDRATAMRNISNPNLQRMRQAPYKFAGHIIEAAEDFLPKFASLVAPDAWQEELEAAQHHYAQSFNLQNFLKTANSHVLGTFTHWLQRYPQLAAGVDKFHGMDKIASIIRNRIIENNNPSAHDSAVPKYRAPSITGSIWDAIEGEEKNWAKAATAAKVEVIYLDAVAASSDLSPADSTLAVKAALSDEEREALMQDRVLIRDKRAAEETTISYTVKDTKQLFNPAESGVYEMLVMPGKFEKCFVAMHPYGPGGRAGFTTVVRLSDPRNWVNVYAGNVWAKSALGTTEFREWWDALPAVKTFKTSDKSRYICVGDQGEATLPFRVEREIGEGDEPLYAVHFSRYCDDRKPGRMGVRGNPWTPQADNYDSFSEGERVRIAGRKGSRIRSLRGDIIVPQGYKVLSVEAAESDSKSDEWVPSWTESHSKNPPIEPGNFGDFERIFNEKTSSLRVMRLDGDRFRINASPPIAKIAALVHLVRDHGLREDVARHMLKSATAVQPFLCRLKYADPYLTDRGPSAPAMPDTNMQGYNPMGFSGDTTTSQGWALPVPELSSFNTDRQKYNPNPMYDDAPFYGGGAQSASQSNQQETFDTSMISSLLRSMNDESLVDRWLPDLVTGMDRLGRLLFSFYWHGDRFADRYGKRDMPELEDSLRNAFEMLGDVIIFLQQKTVRANPEESLRALNLGAAASV